MNDEAFGPLADDDHRLLAAIAHTQMARDPLPAGMLNRLEFAVSLELLHAELATLTSPDLATARADARVTADTITFTSSSTSLMVVITATELGVRIDGWVTGGGLTVRLYTDATVHTAVADATGRLVWPEVRHGRVRFLVEPDRPGARPVVTPPIEV